MKRIIIYFVNIADFILYNKINESFVKVWIKKELVFLEE